MKKCIITFVAIVALFSTVAAADYIVVKNGEKITIHQVTTNSNNSYTWVSTYDLVNPTISQLSSIGLPSQYWSWVNGEDGAYDTRLVKTGQNLNEMKANYENEVESTEYYEERMEWHKVQNIFSVILLLMAVVVIFSQATTIRKLKK